MLNQNFDDKLFHLLVADVKDKAIFLVDNNGCIASWNAGAECLHGYAAHEVLGKPLDTLYSTSGLQPCTDHLNQALLNGRFENTGCMVKADGTSFMAQLTIVALYDDQNQFAGFAHTIKTLAINNSSSSSFQESVFTEKAYAKQAAETTHHSAAIEPLTYKISRNLPAPVANIKGLMELLQDMRMNDREYDALLSALSACAEDLDKVIADVTQILNKGEK